MKKINKIFFSLLILFGFLPTLIKAIQGATKKMDVSVLIVIIAIFSVWLALRYGVVRVLFSGLFGLVGQIVRFLASGFSRDAKFMSAWERWNFLSPNNKGLVVDGHNRLTETISYQNLIAVGPLGVGKTSCLSAAHALIVDDASLVFSDMGGEFFEITSGALKKRGYEIQVLDLIHVGQGDYFNPLQGLKSHTEVAQVAEVIVSSSGLAQGNDPFWHIGAQNIIKVFIQALANLNQPEYLNLTNLKYLINSFSMSGTLDQFMIQATLKDEPTYQEYKGFLTGNENTVNSLITTAQSALSGLNPDLCRMTSINTIDFHQLRKKKTALYVIVRQQDIPYLGFLMNLFFTKLCHALQHDLQESQQGYPVTLCLDEFAQYYVPSFATFAATSRKFRISFCLLLQSLSQLTTRYGADQAATIRNAIGSEEYFSGVALDTAHEISRRMGQKSDGEHRQKPLMRESEVIRLEEDEALLLSGGRDPVKLKLRPYYKQRKLRKLSELPPAPIPNRELPEVQYVPLQPAHQESPDFSEPIDAPQEEEEPRDGEPREASEPVSEATEGESDEEIIQSSND